MPIKLYASKVVIRLFICSVAAVYILIGCASQRLGTHLHNEANSKLAQKVADDFDKSEETTESVFGGMKSNLESVEALASEASKDLVELKIETLALIISRQKWLAIHRHLDNERQNRDKKLKTIQNEINKILAQKNVSAQKVKDIEDAKKEAKKLVMIALREERIWLAWHSIFRSALSTASQQFESDGAEFNKENFSKGLDTILDTKVNVRILEGETIVTKEKAIKMILVSDVGRIIDEQAFIEVLDSLGVKKDDASNIYDSLLGIYEIPEQELKKLGLSKDQIKEIKESQDAGIHLTDEKLKELKLTDDQIAKFKEKIDQQKSVNYIEKLTELAGQYDLNEGQKNALKLLVYVPDAIKMLQIAKAFDPGNAPGIKVLMMNMGLNLADVKVKRAHLHVKFSENHLSHLRIAKTFYEDSSNLNIALSTLKKMGLDKNPNKNKTVADTLEAFRSRHKSLEQVRGSVETRNKIADDIRNIYEIVTRYFVVRTVENQKVNELRVRPSVIDHEYSIALSTVNAKEHAIFVRSGLQSLLAYHQGGVKPETIANFFRLLQTVAIGVIAAEI